MLRCGWRNSKRWDLSSLSKIREGRMKQIAKISMMLTVYLLWICGTTIIDISCYANRQYNHSHYHVHGIGTCDCHHDGCNEMHFESPHSCNHDHSNTIKLYNTNKDGNKFQIQPVAFVINVEYDDNLSNEISASARSSRIYERSVPLPISPTLSKRGMRAPPAVA